MGEAGRGLSDFWLPMKRGREAPEEAPTPQRGTDPGEVPTASVPLLLIALSSLLILEQ